MRPAILALCAALLAWLWLRGHRHPASSDPAWDEPEDGVQPADPVTVRPDLCHEPGCSLASIDHGHGLRRFDDVWPDPDPTYLEARRAAVRRATQSGPVGPSA